MIGTLDEFDVGTLVRLRGQLVGLCGRVLSVDPTRTNAVLTIWSERANLAKFAPKGTMIAIRFAGRGIRNFQCWLPASVLVPADSVTAVSSHASRDSHRDFKASKEKEDASL